MIHILKTYSVYMPLLRSGIKSFDVRENDRNYQVNDFIIFNPIDKNTGETIPHESSLAAKITYILQGGQFGLADGYVVLGISLSHFIRSSDPTSTKDLLEKIQQENLYRDLIGINPKLQEDIIIEEVAELTQAILKYRRYPNDPNRRYNVNEEIADVEICIEQARMMFDSDEIDRIKAQKINRQILLLENIVETPIIPTPKKTNENNSNYTIR